MQSYSHLEAGRQQLVLQPVAAVTQVQQADNCIPQKVQLDRI